MCSIRALTRPGRFDRTVVVNKPDRGGRREMVRYYLNKIRTDELVDIEAIVSDTSWATPARIMSAITKDAVRLALFDDRERVAQRDIELAFQEQAMGLENPIEEMEEDQRRQVAYHEAGHAVVQYYLRPDERIVRVSIVRRSEALGYVLPVSNYDIYALPLRTFVADILVSMAGHVSAKLFLGEYWTGEQAISKMSVPGCGSWRITVISVLHWTCSRVREWSRRKQRWSKSFGESLRTKLHRSSANTLLKSMLWPRLCSTRMT